MALDDEINSCDYRADKGARKRSRPQEFCDSVSIDGTLSVAGAATMGETTAATMNVAGPSIQVGGMTFVPREILTLEGPVMVLAVAGGAEAG